MQKINNKDLIKPLLVIISYFILPCITTALFNQKILNIVICLLYSLVLSLMYKDTFINDFKDIKKNFKRYIKILLLNVLIMFFVIIFTNLLVAFITGIKETSQNDFSLRVMYEKSPIALFFLTVFYYPLVEGIIFRKAPYEIIDKKYPFIIFSALFYFIFNVIYTSISINNILLSICYFFTMLILSNTYYKTKNFTLSVAVISLCNLITYFIVL